ncbi:MAG: DUF418 domain-containing protein [Pseudomonadota bacterium]
MSLAPTQEQDRIEMLDVLRGFALLGILLLNIIGFGLYSGAYSAPGTAMSGPLDVGVWGFIELFAEGAMRGLFSILFGAGVVLFTLGQRTGDQRPSGLHFVRNFWLLIFGIFDAYILLWTGDILLVYALAAFLLFWVRNVSPNKLAICAAVLIVLMSLLHLVSHYGLSTARDVSLQVEGLPAEQISAEQQAAVEAWEGFAVDYEVDEQTVAQEMAARRTSYATALAFTADYMVDILVFVLPLYLFWDALAMMLLGMALYKWRVLQGGGGVGLYHRLMLVGFPLGLAFNGWEVAAAIRCDFDLLASFAQLQWTYHFGRLGMALGYLGLIGWIVEKGSLARLRRALANVGRMALTNYLMHSVICLFVFTGAGLGLVGEFSRAGLYPVVLAIWVLQLWLSTFWLSRYRYGPVEWLWRALTYRQFPALVRNPA